MLTLVLKNELGCVIGEYPVNRVKGVTEGVMEAIRGNYLVLCEGDTLEIKEQ